MACLDDSFAETETSDPLVGLTPEADRFVQLAAFFDDEFTVDDVAAVIGRPVSALVACLREAIDAGVLEEDGERFSFADEGHRRTLCARVPPGAAPCLHLEIGQALLERGSSFRVAARHLLLGAPAGSEHALEALDHAVDALERVAPHEAAWLACHALALTNPTHENRFARAGTAVGALHAAGRVAEAQGLARLVLDRRVPDAPTEAVLRSILASIELLSNRPSDARREAGAVLIIEHAPASVVSDAGVTQLLASAAIGDRPTTRDTIEQVLAGVHASGADATMAAALVAMASFSWADGRIDETLTLLRAAVRREDRGAIGRLRAHARLPLSRVLGALGDRDGADATLDAATEVIDQTRDPSWGSAPTAERARILLADGRLDTAAGCARESLDRATLLGSRLLERIPRAVLSCVALLQGDLREADAFLAVDEHADALIGSSFVPWIRVRVAEAARGPKEVDGLVAALIDSLVVDKRLLLEEPDGAPWLVRAAVANGDAERAQMVVRLAAGIVDGNPHHVAVRAGAEHARALLDQQAEALAAVADLHAQPWARASAAEDAGVAFEADGDAERATAQFEAALAGMTRIGAERDAARLRSRLRRLGVRPCHWHHEARPVFGWESLTQTEELVADLVSEGLTNAQVAERMYLSRHTIDFHLRQIFRKLGIRSRVALTRMSLERIDQERPATRADGAARDHAFM
jgi:DNA-binding CsgD family transcriptional regulator